MEYCFEAHHGDEDNADAAQCLTLEEAQANMNGVEIPDFLDMLCEDTKDMGDGTNDCKVCKSRANPAAYCVTVDANICECVESKSTMDFVATQDGAECPADGDLNVDICDDCEIDISITCVAKAPSATASTCPALPTVASPSSARTSASRRSSSAMKLKILATPVLTGGISTSPPPEPSPMGISSAGRT